MFIIIENELCCYLSHKESKTLCSKVHYILSIAFSQQCWKIPSKSEEKISKSITTVSAHSKKKIHYKFLIRHFPSITAKHYPFRLQCTSCCHPIKSKCTSLSNHNVLHIIIQLRTRSKIGRSWGLRRPDMCRSVVERSI